MGKRSVLRLPKSECEHRKACCGYRFACRLPPTPRRGRTPREPFLIFGQTSMSRPVGGVEKIPLPGTSLTKRQTSSRTRPLATAEQIAARPRPPPFRRARRSSSRGSAQRRDRMASATAPRSRSPCRIDAEHAVELRATDGELLVQLARSTCVDRLARFLQCDRSRLGRRARELREVVGDVRLGDDRPRAARARAPSRTPRW